MKFRPKHIERSASRLRKLRGSEPDRIDFDRVNGTISFVWEVDGDG